MNSHGRVNGNCSVPNLFQLKKLDNQLQFVVIYGIKIQVIADINPEVWP